MWSFFLFGVLSEVAEAQRDLVPLRQVVSLVDSRQLARELSSVDGVANDDEHKPATSECDNACRRRNLVLSIASVEKSEVLLS